MRICILGKYPPIQGGVSSRTYLAAHALAARGHRVDVVTNALEVRPPYRMFMGDADWAVCEAAYEAADGGAEGRVAVHWTDPYDRSQFHIPRASPHVSKLATLAIEAARESGAEVVYSYYVEPYGIAGHVAAEALGLPHVVRTAGSDAGRLWDHPQFNALYDHVFRSAALVMASGAVYDKMRAAGVPPARLVTGAETFVPTDLFAPDGPALDVDALVQQVADDDDPEMRDLAWGAMPADAPCIGVYGKLGARKGTFALLDALVSLAGEGRDFGLLVMGHGRPRGDDFRAAVEARGLAGRVRQVPFLPYWRVPEFLRRCRAVCCLEQGFPIAFHGPVIPREVLASGTCLVAATEILLKTPGAGRLIDGYNCLAVSDVDDTRDLAARLAAVLDDPAGAAELGRRGRRFMLELQSDATFPRLLERTLAAAAETAGGGDGASRIPGAAAAQDSGASSNAPPPSFAALAIQSLTSEERLALLAAPPDQVPSEALGHVIDALRLDMLDVEAETPTVSRSADDLLARMFRLGDASDRPIDSADLDGMVPLRSPGLRTVELPFDILAARGDQLAGRLARNFPPSPTIVALAAHDGAGPTVLDGLTATILDACDGTASVAQLVERFGPAEDAPAAPGAVRGRIEALFEAGLVDLRPEAGPGATR